MWIHCNHALIQLSMLLNQHLWIPRSRDKDGIDTTVQRDHEAPGDLETDQKCIEHNDGGEGAARVVRRVRDIQIYIGDQCTGDTNEQAAHRQDGTHQTFVNQRVDATVLDHAPGFFGTSKVCLAIQGDVTESISVDELQSPLHQPEDALQEAKEDICDHISRSSGLIARGRASEAQKVQNCDEKTAESDGAKAVRQGSARCSSSGALGWVVGREIPTAIHARDGSVNHILEELCDPVSGEGHVDNQTDDRGATAGSTSAASRIVVAGLKSNIDGHQGRSEPRSEERCSDASQKGHQVDMPVFARHVYGSLEQEDGKGDSFDPADETEDAEHGNQ